jgi:hypothetical protein
MTHVSFGNDEIHHMSPSPFIDRILHRKAPPSQLPMRVDIQPPQLWPRRESLWSMALRWLVGNDTDAVPSLRTPLDKARAEFVAAMEGLSDPGSSADLLRRAQHARSLRELWHLRSELYTLIARRVSEVEARTRLARVNQHFPSRAARSSTGVSVLPENSDA